MKKSTILFFCSIITIGVAAQGITKPPRDIVLQRTPVLLNNPAISNEVIRSYDWWKYVNPTNVNYFATFTGVNAINYDTGAVNFSKRTAISLAGWVNQNVNLGTAISDDSLSHLEPLIYLEQLLIRANITDQGLLHIRPLTNLRHFEIVVSGSPNYNITDKGMYIIGGLGNMEILRLYFCSKITDYGLQQLIGLSKLKELILNGCGITANGLNDLRSFSKLETLGLAATGITDKGADILIQLLPSLPALTKIIISNSKITQQGRNNLMAARRGLSVIY